ncbi:MAG: DNA-3-methyladenine glycosylase I [Candidatus Eremiobacteraeota bacterium]|nr:DNA-3-methyladenine glycosylase I [Candidatus Eremiobacteraeota bacterium]
MPTTRRRSRANHPRIASPTDADYLAVMSRAVFQAGLSWAAIDRQWEQLLVAFDGFAPAAVAAYNQRDVERIMEHPGILHSERKINATIHNAQALLAAAKEHGSVRRYLRSLGGYDGVVADLKRRFSHVGDISAYYFLFRCGEAVPPFSRWIKTVKGDHPRIREMVQAYAQR